MTYAMLVNLGPQARDWRSLSEDEQKTIAAGYQEIDQMRGVTPGAARVPAACMGGAIEMRRPWSGDKPELT